MNDFVIDMTLEGNLKNKLYISVEDDEPLIPEDIFDAFNIKEWYMYEAS